MVTHSFARCVESVLANESSAVSRNITRRDIVYSGGNRDDKIYFVVAGHVKLIMGSPEGKECLLAIYTGGDLFGESCLSGDPRNETAVAMSNTVIRQVPGTRFLALMLESGLIADFVGFLAGRLSEQQQIITNLATAGCEYRLGLALLRLSEKLGSSDSFGLRQRISHQELSQMVGTTRPRVSEFMQRFRDRGLIDITPDSRIFVREQLLRQHIESGSMESSVSAVAS
jgi:CRP/FNR family cyclic AMP-dependent transcriptional regulator